MLLSKIIPKIFLNKPNCIKVPSIESIQIDSRVKSSNSVFFAMQGLTINSHDYIPQAIENGAVAIVYSDSIPDIVSKYKNIEFIKTDDVQTLFLQAVKIFYNDPSSKLNMYAITGTNGKTTTAYILQYLLSEFEKTGYIGTLGYKVDDKIVETNHMTTPDNITLHEVLKRMIKNDVKNISIELSSHGLELSRASNINIDTAIFTNLTHDHLDFHGSMENYLKSKLKLFKNLNKNAISIINIDDEYSKHFRDASNCKIMTYGKDKKADYVIDKIKLYPNKSEFQILNKDKTYEISTNLIGEFNVYNLTASIVAIHENGYKIEKILPHTNSINLEIGRMDVLKDGERTIIIDFAHTPDAMEKVFEFAKSTISKNKKIITVFGSAGARDRDKRAVMGKIADDFCDIIILTEDDYRMEDPLDISNDIASGISNKEKIHIIKSREKAIKKAIQTSENGDIILILGKGIDNFMYVEDKILNYDGDYNIAKSMLKI